MHDGSMKDLEDVIAHYAKGGNPHVNKDKRIVPFTITDKEQEDLLDFFKALTDTSYMKDFR